MELFACGPPAKAYAIFMANGSERSSAVGKIVLHSVSKRVTLIFKDGRTEEFHGRNFYAAQAVAEKSRQEGQDLQLVDDHDFGAVAIVPKGVLVETVDD